MALTQRPINTRRSKQLAYTRKAFLLLIFGVAQCIFWSSRLFSLDTISVLGNDHLSSEMIVAQAELPLGEHLFALPLRECEERLRRLHWVKEVTVRRHVPGMAVIRVRERAAAIAVARDTDTENRWFLVSEDGIILAPAGWRGNDKLPHVLVNTPIQVGSQLNPHIVESVRICLRELPASLRQIMQDIHADSNGSLGLNLELLGQPVDVRLGDAERIHYKFEVLQALIERIQQEGQAVTYVDLRYADPVVGRLTVAGSEKDSQAVSD